MRINSAKGVVLVTVLIFAVLIMIIAAAVVNTITSQARTTEHQVRRITAYYSAESGIYYAMSLLSATHSFPLPFPNTQLTIDEDNYQTTNITIEQGLGTININSTADYTR